MDKEVTLLEYFEKNFLANKGITNIYSKGKFYSKKNDVYKIEIKSGTSKGIYVLKKYRGQGRYLRMKNELFFYHLLMRNNFKVPCIFYSNKDILVTELMGDITLLDYIIEKEDSDSNTDLFNLADFRKRYPPIFGSLKYIYDFNRIAAAITGESYILNDMNFRNFLLCGSNIYRVDFEDCRMGDMEEDMGKFIAFFMTYNPVYTEWKKNISEMIRNYLGYLDGISISRVELEMEKELIRIKERRK